jgi:hypothetical protein
MVRRRMPPSYVLAGQIIPARQGSTRTSRPAFPQMRGSIVVDLANLSRRAKVTDSPTGRSCRSGSGRGITCPGSRCSRSRFRRPPAWARMSATHPTCRESAGTIRTPRISPTAHTSHPFPRRCRRPPCLSRPCRRRWRRSRRHRPRWPRRRPCRPGLPQLPLRRPQPSRHRAPWQAAQQTRRAPVRPRARDRAACSPLPRRSARS